MDEQERVLVKQYGYFFDAVHTLVRSYNYLGRFDAALNLLQIAEQISHYPEAFWHNRFDMLQTYAEIRLANYFLTNTGSDEMFDLVQKIYQEEKEVVEEVYGGPNFTYGNNRNTIHVASALCLIGQAHYYYTLKTGRGSYNDVLAYFQQSMDMWEKLEEGYKLHTVGWNDPTSKDFQPDEHLRNYILFLIEKGMSRSLFYTGLVYECLGEKELARDSSQRALGLALHADAKEEASYASSQLASLCENQEQKLEYALQSLALREEIGFKRLLPYSHLLICDLYLQRNDLEKAQDHCHTAFQLAEEIEIKIPLTSLEILNNVVNNPVE